MEDESPGGTAAACSKVEPRELGALAAGTLVEACPELRTAGPGQMRLEFGVADG